jgi:hypothetical protein
MPKITYTYPHNGLTIKAVNAYHQETLFFGLLFPVIEQQAQYEESIYEVCGRVGADWAKQELAVIGFVSTYHMWERQLQELFLEQAERFNLTIPPSIPRENIVQYGKRVLLNTFEAAAPEECWLELDRARVIVNAFKHGPSKKFDAAMKAYPDFFFTPPEMSHLPMVSISCDQLQQLIKTVATFWDVLPRQIDYVQKSI